MHVGCKVGAHASVGETDKTEKNRVRGMCALQCRGYYYSGVVRPSDHEMTTTEKTTCYSQLPRGGDIPHNAGSYGEVQGWIRRWKKWKETRAKAFIVVSTGEGAQMRQVSQFRVG